jgi:uncharacterized membrane protein YgdD (TMEM256/DUF423 family)
MSAPEADNGRMRPNRWIAIGALSAAVAVACGAFGAHMLKTRLDAVQLAIWQTGVLYHMLHSLALVLFGLVRSRYAGNSIPGWAFLIGIACFSGSLYGLALGGPSFLGPITPIGGMCFLFGWIILAWQAWSDRR